MKVLSITYIFHFTQQVACDLERTLPKRRGHTRQPERKAGTDHCTHPPQARQDAPLPVNRTVVGDHGDGNTGRLPLRTAVEGAPREARKWKIACHLFRYSSRAC